MHMLRVVDVCVWGGVAGKQRRKYAEEGTGKRRRKREEKEEKEIKSNVTL